MAQVFITFTCSFGINNTRSSSLRVSTVSVPSLLLGLPHRCQTHMGCKVWVSFWHFFRHNSGSNMQWWCAGQFVRKSGTTLPSFCCVTAMLLASGFGLWTCTLGARLGRVARSQLCNWRRTLASSAAYSWPQAAHAAFSSKFQLHMYCTGSLLCVQIQLLHNDWNGFYSVRGRFGDSLPQIPR